MESDLIPNILIGTCIGALITIIIGCFVLQENFKSNFLEDCKRQCYPRSVQYFNPTDGGCMCGEIDPAIWNLKY